MAAEVQKAEEAIRKRVCLGNQVNTMNLLNDLENKYSRTIANQAVSNMIKNQELREIKTRKVLIR